jgi:alanyl-tRNA synthetase
LFQTVIGAAEERLSRGAEGEALGSFRVIADHLRAMSFLIADGVSPSNEGRGYVLRRIMRRAMRHAHILGAREPVLADLVPVLAAEMGAAYPALVAATPYIAATVAGEEERFQRTLGRGLEHLEDAVKGLGEGGALDGEIAFRLYDTYGFPLDLTQDVLRGRGLGVDTDGFNVAMERQREQARATWQGSGDARTEEVWLTLGQTVGASAFLGYTALEGAGQIVALLRDGVEVDALEAGDTGAVVLDQTPAYAESGGQAGDHGVLSAGTARFHFTDTQKRAGGLHVHVGTLTGEALRKGDRVDVEVDAVRRARLRSNHSATHLLHAALRRHLGPHVAQKGSLVEADRLRFDFTHGKPLTAAEIEAIEAEVNAVIRQNAAAVTEVMSPDAAVAAGAVALFGEKYGEQVRVLRLGDDPTATDRPYSVELCGGTHVARTGDIAVFTLLSETGVSAGVRRVEATTGADALAYLKAQADLARSVAELLKAPVGDVPARVEALLEQRRKLEASLADAKRKAALGGAGPVNDVETVGTVQAILRVAEGVAARDIRNLIDEAKTRVGSGVVAFVAVNEGKATLAVGVTPDLTARISAVDLVKVGAEPVGGKGGGGRPDMAQAGGPNGDQAEAALAAIRTALAAI